MVTGGSKGIGFGLAKGLVRFGDVENEGKR